MPRTATFGDLVTRIQVKLGVGRSTSGEAFDFFIECLRASESDLYNSIPEIRNTAYAYQSFAYNESHADIAPLREDGEAYDDSAWDVRDFHDYSLTWVSSSSGDRYAWEPITAGMPSTWSDSQTEASIPSYVEAAFDNGSLKFLVYPRPTQLVWLRWKFQLRNTPDPGADPATLASHESKIDAETLIAVALLLACERYAPEMMQTQSILVNKKMRQLRAASHQRLLYSMNKNNYDGRNDRRIISTIPFARTVSSDGEG